MRENDTLIAMKECFEKVVPAKQDKRTSAPLLDFIINFIFCFFQDSKTFSLESIRRKMIKSLGKSYSRSAFWERLSRNRLKNFLRNIVAELMRNLHAPIGISNNILNLLDVKGIRLVDSSSITLKECAKEIFPGTFTSASIKWHACFDLLTGAMTWFQLTPGKVHDRRCFPDINSLQGMLVIFDLGYYDYNLLYLIEKANGFFLSRLKSNAAIVIEKVIHGLPQNIVGERLLSLNFAKSNEEIVEVITKKSHDGDHFFFRVIGFWNPGEKCYHWYITNLKVAAFLIYPLYRLRWQIELIFKACKNSLDASEIPSANANIIENLLLSSIAAYLCSHTLLNVCKEQLSEEEQLATSFQRAAKVSVTLSEDFSTFILSPSQKNLNNLIEKIKLFATELFDPNYKRRETSLMRVYRLLPLTI